MVILRNCLRKLISFPLKNFIRRNHIYVEKIRHRGIIKLEGSDSPSFLQGIITNDVNHLLEGSISMYSLVLNNKGRVKHDIIVYKSGKDNSYLIESDTESLPKLEKHLKLYRLKKDVTITTSREYSVYQIFDLNEIIALVPEELRNCITQEYNIVPSDAESRLNQMNFQDGIISCRDPRLSTLGLRIVASEGTDLLNTKLVKDFRLQENTLYKLCRLWLGVAEGLDEFPYEQCFPLEMNCDYLHGVSFHKGCYIGQELTARSHHTGVIRKRIMPVVFESDTNSDLPENIFSVESEGKSIGKLRTIEGRYGLALLRVSECLKAPKLKCGNSVLNCAKPLWWPLEVSKDKLVN